MNFSAIENVFLHYPMLVENGPFEENHTNPKIKTFKPIRGWLGS